MRCLRLFGSSCCFQLVAIWGGRCCAIEPYKKRLNSPKIIKMKLLKSIFVNINIESKLYFSFFRARTHNWLQKNYRVNTWKCELNNKMNRVKFTDVMLRKIQSFVQDWHILWKFSKFSIFGSKSLKWWSIQRFLHLMGLK